MTTAMRHSAAVSLFLLLAAGAPAVATTMPSLTAIYSFKANTLGTHDGSEPNGGLTADGGVYYGVTRIGGAFNSGTIFKIDAAGNEAPVYSFHGKPDGALPLGGLVLYKGLLFGTTNVGGTNNLGTIFFYDPAKNSVGRIYNFAGGADGALPASSLIEYNNLLYGVTSQGGGSLRCPAMAGCGTLFTIDPLTNNTPVILHTFKGGPADGSAPEAPVTILSNVLFGTTATGGGTGCTGGNGCGTVFKFLLASPGYSWVGFAGGTGGAFPNREVLAHGGLLYGTTQQGGSGSGCGPGGCGTIFTVTPAPLSVAITYGGFGGNNGSKPNSGLTLMQTIAGAPSVHRGITLGVTSLGGNGSGAPARGAAGSRATSPAGTLYQFDLATNAETVDYNFNNATGGTGGTPTGPLLETATGVYWGETKTGGAAASGTIYVLRMPPP